MPRGRALAAVVIIAATVLLAQLGFIACGGGSNRVPPTADSIEAGRVLFQTNCRVCHGDDGRGSTLAPDLTVHVPTRNDDFLFGRITKGFESAASGLTMPAFGGVLSETERWHLVNYLRETFGTLTFTTPSGS